MQLRPSVQSLAFDALTFAKLRRDLLAGHLSLARSRLGAAPPPLDGRLGPVTKITDSDSASLRSSRIQSGEAAIRAGKIAVLILNGGMATRFGGGAKGTVSLVPDRSMSFLGLKLAQIQALAKKLHASIPTVLMHSFSTADASNEHLAQIDWQHTPLSDRYQFLQSIMPRVDTQGLALADYPNATSWPDTLVYAAPGHGDTLARLQASGVLSQLCERGVEHILISNVDNVAATLDPEICGAHLDAVEHGAAMSIEAVQRHSGEAGGCIAQMQLGPAIVEAFRLPTDTSLDAYPDFNTNTLWFSVSALEHLPTLRWFPVARELESPEGNSIAAIQFEQLIGEASEHLPSHMLRVQRERRFLPIKSREDLDLRAQDLRRCIDELSI